MARSVRINTLAVVALCCFLSLGETRAEAQGSAADKAAAEALFDRGLALMREGKYQEACERLEQSQSVERGIGTMLYLAECYEKVGKTASAWATFREASSWAQAAGQPERAEAGKRRAEKVEKSLSRLTVRVADGNNVPGLEVRDNGAPVNKNVWGVALPVDPGTHHIEAKATGYEPFSIDIVVEPRGASSELTVPALIAIPGAAVASTSTGASTSEPTSTPVDAAPATSAGPERMSTQRIVGIVVGGVGVVALGIGTVFGIRAIDKNDDAKDVCSGSSCSTERGETLSDQAMTSARTANALIATGGVLVVGGLITFLVAPKTRRADVAFHVDHNGAGVQVGGVF